MTTGSFSKIMLFIAIYIELRRRILKYGPIASEEAYDLAVAGVFIPKNIKDKIRQWVDRYYSKGQYVNLLLSIILVIILSYPHLLLDLASPYPLSLILTIGIIFYLWYKNIMRLVNYYEKTHVIRFLKRWWWIMFIALGFVIRILIGSP